MAIPKRWHKRAKDFHRQTSDTYVLESSDTCVLDGICESLSMFWTACDEVSRDGITFLTGTGQRKLHPGVGAAKHAWQSVLAGCRLLGIGVPAQPEKPDKPRPGFQR